MSIEEESVDLTPGTVWTHQQLEVVGMLLARSVKAEAKVQRIRDLHRATGYGWCEHCGDLGEGDNRGKTPCTTMRALDGLA